ncbi:MAG TPA: hypothetical protein LFV90_06350 [Rickettsia endosymbiont of Columbicola hoogstraali]|nr:hypothetical protein [Rickettsia endosymbiont of Columbicola hoogstraali]
MNEEKKNNDLYQLIILSIANINVPKNFPDIMSKNIRKDIEYKIVDNDVGKGQNRY